MRDEIDLRQGYYPTRVPFETICHGYIGVVSTLSGLKFMPMRVDGSALVPKLWSSNCAALWFLNAVFPYTDRQMAQTTLDSLPLPILRAVFRRLALRYPQQPTGAYWQAMCLFAHIGTLTTIRHHILSVHHTALRDLAPWIGTCLFRALRNHGFDVHPWRNGPFSINDGNLALALFDHTLVREEVTALNAVPYL